MLTAVAMNSSFWDFMAPPWGFFWPRPPVKKETRYILGRVWQPEQGNTCPSLWYLLGAQQGAKPDPSNAINTSGAKDLRCEGGTVQALPWVSSRAGFQSRACVLSNSCWLPSCSLV